MEEYSLDNFAAVWDRVTSDGKSDMNVDLEAARLRRFMDITASEYSAYGHLLPRAKGTAGRMISEIAAVKKRQMKTLQTIHFIFTGDTYAPSVTKDRSSSTLESLRFRYKNENDSAKEYKKAWNETENDRLIEIYASFSDDCAHNARLIEKLIGELIV